MENFFKCPKCEDLSYENFIPNIGRHLLCPYCKTKFSFEPKHLIGKGTKLGLVKRYSEVELNQLFSTTFKNTEAPVAEEPQEETSPEPPKAEAVEVAVSELPKEDTTSIRSCHLISGLPPHCRPFPRAQTDKFLQVFGTRHSPTSRPTVILKEIILCHGSPLTIRAGISWVRCPIVARCPFNSGREP